MTIIFRRIVSRAAALTSMALAGLMTVVAPYVAAEVLRDPTRPANVAPAGKPASASGPELQSILISPRRKVAVISGQSVGPGDKFGDARVISLTESQVTLQRGNQKQVLKLFSGVEKNFGPPPEPVSSTLRSDPSTRLQR